MKKILLLLFINISFAQEIKFFVGEKTYIPAELVFYNGEIQKGEILDFNTPQTVEIDKNNPLMFGKFGEIHKAYKRTSIEFKGSSNEIKKIDSNLIKEIHYLKNKLYGEVIFRRLNLITIDKNGKTNNTNNYLFLPLVKEDKINFYGYGIVVNNKNYTTMMYIQNNNSSDVYCLNDFNLFDIFHYKENLIKNIKYSFQNINPNCDIFNEFVVNYDIKENGSLKELNEKQKEIVKESKSIKDLQQRNIFVTAQLLDWYYLKFELYFQNYNKFNCDNQ